jgi:hypothetical protein
VSCPRGSLLPLGVTNMKILISITLIAFSAIALADEERSMECGIGPITKTFGNTEWLVYGCSDGRSVRVVPGPGNPAMQFYFLLSPKDGKVEIHGEGLGSKDATEAAYQDLEKLSVEEIAALFSESQKRSASDTHDRSVQEPNKAIHATCEDARA